MKKLKKYFVFDKKTFFSYFFLGILALIIEYRVEGYLIRSAIPSQIKSFLLFVTSSLFFLTVIFLIDIKKKNFARSISFISGGIFILLCILILFISMFGVPERFLKRQFDSSSWKSARSVNTEKSGRLRMVDDLLSKRELVGMSKKQIDQLLGIPDQDDRFPECDYIYWLGSREVFLGSEDKWFCIKFKEQKVTEANIKNIDND